MIPGLTPISVWCYRTGELMWTCRSLLMLMPVHDTWQSMQPTNVKASLCHPYQHRGPASRHRHYLLSTEESHDPGSRRKRHFTTRNSTHAPEHSTVWIHLSVHHTLPGQQQTTPAQQWRYNTIQYIIIYLNILPINTAFSRTVIG